MAKVARHRNALIQTAIRLFREKGYAATGLSEILSVSGAPKGSLYYYFPRGKEQLAEEAITIAGKTVEQTLRELAESTGSPRQFVDAYCEQLAGWMEKSNFKSGCPITTTVLETVPESAGLTIACQNAFAIWVAVVADVYKRAGYSQVDAEARGEFVISAVEGALIQARVQQSPGPIRRLAALLT